MHTKPWKICTTASLFIINTLSLCSHSLPLLRSLPSSNSLLPTHQIKHVLLSSSGLVFLLKEVPLVTIEVTGLARVMWAFSDRTESHYLHIIAIHSVASYQTLLRYDKSDHLTQSLVKS